MRKIDCDNPDKFEVLVTASTLKGHKRKLVILACYLPPGYSKKRGDEALSYINGVIVGLKQKYTDPSLSWREILISGT